MEHIELKEFIKNTLVEIATGIRMANDELKNPDKDQFEVFNLRRNIGDDSKIPGIQFDIAVTAAKDQKDKAGFMVALINLGGSAGTEKALSNELVHRIKFEVGINSTWI
ncbi:MAG: hypothetical protein KBB01_04110 [Candidatus Omnitrophica bacterium]|jgi:hypothetical protein|nr:hypothetical protein [Candidatus Omnitrophota bacterium]